MKIEVKKLIRFLKIKLIETSPIAMKYKKEIVKRLKQSERKVTIKVMHPLKKSSQLREIAEMVSEFYGLDVILGPSISNPSYVDLKIITPSGKVVGLFCIFFHENQWLFGGQTFIISKHLEELRVKAYQLEKK